MSFSGSGGAKSSAADLSPNERTRATGGRPPQHHEPGMPEPGYQNPWRYEDGIHPNGNDGSQAHKQTGQPNPSLPATWQHETHNEGLTNATTGNSEQTQSTNAGTRNQLPAGQSQQTAADAPTQADRAEATPPANPQPHQARYALLNADWADPPEQQPAAPQQAKIKKRTKATLKIASLNMRGRGNDKWNHINQIIRDKKIGVLVAQETHLDDNQVDHLHSLFDKRIKIHHTIDPHRPNAKGVAIILNKEITNTQNVVTTEIIPGRALLVQIPWHTNLIIKILAVYAPNTVAENEAFWNAILEKWQRDHIPKPDLMIGDYNLVESSIDRLPCHTDNALPVMALQNLKSMLLLHDGWRRTHPTKKAYTVDQKTVAMFCTFSI